MKQKIYLNGNINIFSVFTSNSESGRPGAGSKLFNLKDYFKSVKYTQFMIFSPIFMKILSNYQKSLFTDTCNMLYVSKQHLLLKFNYFIFYPHAYLLLSWAQFYRYLFIFVYGSAECATTLPKCTKVKLLILNNFDQPINIVSG